MVKYSTMKKVSRLIAADNSNESSPAQFACVGLFLKWGSFQRSEETPTQGDYAGLYRCITDRIFSCSSLETHRLSKACLQPQSGQMGVWLSVLESAGTPE